MVRAFTLPGPSTHRDRAHCTCCLCARYVSVTFCVRVTSLCCLMICFNVIYRLCRISLLPPKKSIRVWSNWFTTWWRCFLCKAPPTCTCPSRASEPFCASMTLEWSRDGTRMRGLQPSGKSGGLLANIIPPLVWAQPKRLPTCLACALQLSFKCK